jgi:hypothetical protein
MGSVVGMATAVSRSYMHSSRYRASQAKLTYTEASSRRRALAVAV